MSIRRNTIAMAVLAAALMTGSQAHSDIIISANGVSKADDPTNSSAMFSGAVGNFNINNIFAIGVAAFGGNGLLLDVSSADVSSTGSGTLQILVTETNLSEASPSDFTFLFSANTLTHIDVTRSFFLDTTNNGLETTPLGSTTGTGGGNSVLENPGGLFSITEELDLTATGPGATLSADDSVAAPEPASLLLFGPALAGLALFLRRRIRPVALVGFP